MPLLEEIEIIVPFVGELPERIQKIIAKDMARWVVMDEDEKTMTEEELNQFCKIRREASRAIWIKLEEDRRKNGW